jgi:hypothetical protein
VVVIPLDKVTLPATIRLALIVNVLVYPVHVKLNRALVLAPTVQAADAALKITSSPAAGIPGGDQLAAVAQVDAVVAIQVLVAIYYDVNAENLVFG